VLSQLLPKMSGLSNYYLEELALKLLGKKQFIGVFSADGLSHVPKKKNFCLIFNDDPSNLPGNHFLSLFVTPGKVHYFDSFGDRPIQKDISEFIRKTNRKCVKHCITIQHRSSNFCGYFALSFLLWMTKRRKINDYYKMFNLTNLKENNCIVTEFILNEIK